MKEDKRHQREEMMISLIEQWRESGKTQKVFCREKGIALATFYYWLKRHRQRLDEKGFLPVEISSGAGIEIRYPDGVILQLPASTRVAVIKQLLSL